MKEERQKSFDRNREMELSNEELLTILQKQQADIQILNAKIEQLITLQQVPQQMPQQVEPQDSPGQFKLNPDQFLNYVNKLRIFNGRNEYTVQEFISTVERTFLLCSDTPGLKEYAVNIVVTDKIQGEAKRCIQRLGTSLETSWDDVKQELKLHYRPREDYAELIDQCRSIKASTLRELFYSIREISFKLNELYEFDDTKPETYHPKNNDKYLADIISFKIHDFLRGNIPENASIIEIYNKFDKLKLLDNEEGVDLKSRKPKGNKLTFDKRISSQVKQPSNNNNEGNKFNSVENKQHIETGYNNNSTNFVNKTSQNFNRINKSNVVENNQHTDTGYNNNNTTNYANRPSQNFNRINRFNNGNNINFQNNNETRQRQIDTEPMEIGHFDRDVNFYNEPQNQEFQ